jgi:hypothetical protein
MSKEKQKTIILLSVILIVTLLFGVQYDLFPFFKDETSISKNGYTLLVGLVVVKMALTLFTKDKEE